MLLDEVKAFLVAAGITGTLNLGRLQDDPDAQVALQEYGGGGALYTMGASVGSVMEVPRLQVACRAGDYVTARTKAEAVYRALDTGGHTLSGTRYYRLMPLGPPAFLRTDQNDRYVIGFSVEVIKDRS